MDFNLFYAVLEEVSRFSGLPVTLYFIFVRPRSPLAYFAFGIGFLSFFFDIISFPFIKYIYANSYILINTWAPLDTLLTFIAFYFLIPRFRRSIMITAFIFLVGVILSHIFIFSFLEDNSFVKIYRSVSIVLFSCITYFEIIRIQPVEKLSTYPVFWFNTAIFLYGASGLIFGTFINYLVFKLDMPVSELNRFWMINLIFNIVKQLLLFYTVFLVAKGEKDRINPEISS